MTTKWPVTLPAIDPNRWNASHLEYGRIHRDDGYPENWVTWEIDAPDATTAELRVFAHLNHDYEDDLKGSSVTAEKEVAPGRWLVRYVNYYD